MGASKLGAELLIENIPEKAKVIAQTLHSLNEDRKLLEREMQSTAKELVGSIDQNPNLTWVAKKDWSPGLTGILASRLKETFGKSCIVMAIDKDGIGKGSGRSVDGCNLGKAISQLEFENLIITGGGHKLAAGLTVEENMIEAAMSRLSEILAAQKIESKNGSSLEILSLISLRAITLDFIEEFERAGPFGSGSPAPTFVIANCKIAWCKLVGDKHLKFDIVDQTNRQISSIFFRALDTKAGIFLNENQHMSFHFAGTLEINSWSGGRRPNFVVRDIALVA